MFDSDIFNEARTAEVNPPISGLFLASGILAVAIVGAAAVTNGSALVPLIIFGLVVAIVMRGLRWSYPHDVLGLCNVVTLVRAAMVAFLAGAAIDATGSGWLVFWVAAIAFALDGIDGWLARRAGLTSRFGARFDMETDALLAAVLAVWLLATGTTGPEILILGFMRYLFCAASFFVTALRAELPESYRRKAVCVIQIGALIALLFPMTPEVMAVPVSFFAAILLCWSFAVDINWLLRRST
ncbi:MAG: CDP-alcohol phosphatidyltransferase family protein [Ruegeria sp.]|nr:CDP-alcohol phosphatidyltransferase family protein [Ruegeria sp.]